MTNKKIKSKPNVNINKLTDSVKKRLNVKKNKVKRTEQIHQFSTTTWLVIYIIGAIAAVMAIVSLTRNQISINEKQKIYDDLQSKVEIQQAENNELENKLNGSLDDYIEDYARDKLDMVKPGERVYINTAGD